jgi:hypothetical protein
MYLYNARTVGDKMKSYSSSSSLDDDLVSMNDSTASSTSSSSSSEASFMLTDPEDGLSTESSSSKPTSKTTTVKSATLQELNEKDEEEECEVGSAQKLDDEEPKVDDEDDEIDKESRRKVMNDFNITLNYLNQAAAGANTNIGSSAEVFAENFTCVTHMNADRPSISLATLNYEPIEYDMQGTEKLLQKESINDLTVQPSKPKSEKRHSKIIDNILRQANNPTSKMAAGDSIAKAHGSKEKRLVCGKLAGLLLVSSYGMKALFLLFSGNLINDDDLSLFVEQKKNLLKSENSEDYNSFKKPLMFNNQNDMSINSNCLTAVAYKSMKQKHESTPIIECNESTQLARRKHLQSQIEELNSTMRLQSKMMATATTAATATATTASAAAHANRIYSTTTTNLNRHQYAIKQQQLKQIQSLNYICGNNVQKVKTSDQQFKNQAPMLNISHFAALTNASAAANIVPISQAELPKKFKKSLRDDLKKEKKSCVIQ